MLYTFPQAGPAPIVHFIDAAREQLGINVYYLHDRRVLRAIKAAVHRGVTVSVIVDGKPYGMSCTVVE